LSILIHTDQEQATDKLEQKKWPTFLGNEPFVKWLKGTFFERKRHSQIPESVSLAPVLETIKQKAV